MPNLHDIERRINSVSSTKQITRTMEMVAAAKIRRASVRVENSLPWSTSLMNAMQSTALYAVTDAVPLLVEHSEVKRSVVMVVTSDRGLAGGFNSNVLRQADKIIKEKERQGIEVEVISCGKKGCGYFEYQGIKPMLEFRDLSADPTYDQAARIASFVSDGYVNGRYDEVIMVFNHAKNNAEQTLISENLLPIPEKRLDEILGLKTKEQDIYFGFREHIDDHYDGDVDIEPSPERTLTDLMKAYLQSTVYLALIDSAAGEQGARRTAMKAATDNANEMVKTLTRLYNRERQGAITTEITEIVGGAAALEE